MKEDLIQMLSMRFIGPYEIVEKIGSLAYRLAQNPELSQIYDVFHVSMLRRYRSDLTHVLKDQEVENSENFSYVEEQVKKKYRLQAKTVEKQRYNFSQSIMEEPYSGRSYMGDREVYEKQVLSHI